MKIRKSAVFGLALLALALARATPASADLQINFDQSNYTINAVGGTVAVNVSLSQVCRIRAGDRRQQRARIGVDQAGDQ